MEHHATSRAPRRRWRFYLGLVLLLVGAGVALSFGIRAELQRRRMRDRLARQEEVLRALEGVDIPLFPAAYDFE